MRAYIARLTRLMLTRLVSGSTGIVCTLMPRYAAPLSKAACAVTGTTLSSRGVSARACRTETGTHISGSLIPFTALAQSRYVLHAMTMLSVPPLVVVPAPVGLLYIRRHIATTSASILRTAGKTSG